MPRPTVSEQIRDAIIKEHNPESSVRATCSRLRKRGVSVSEATARSVLRDSGAIAAATQADTVCAPPEAIAAAVADDVAEGRVGHLRKRLAWVGEIINRAMPAVEAGDGAGVGNLQKLMAIEASLLKTLHEIEPRADKESAELTRLGMLANGEIVERARRATGR